MKVVIQQVTYHPDGKVAYNVLAESRLGQFLQKITFGLLKGKTVYVPIDHPLLSDMRYDDGTIEEGCIAPIDFKSHNEAMYAFYEYWTEQTVKKEIVRDDAYETYEVVDTFDV